ncbi:FUSC family protein [Synechococcus sp. FGCU-3]|nr:FUSC family protein [Synechococcus sp. FGCU3]
MTSRARPVLLVLLVVICLLLAEQIARGLGIERAGGILCLASLATLVVGFKLGWQRALVGVGSLSALSVPAILSQANPVAATVLMTLTALFLGLSARRQLQPVYWLMVVSLCLLITNGPLPPSASPSELTRLVIGLLATGGVSTLLQHLMLPAAPTADALSPQAIAHSWRRCLAYGLLLASAALFTTPIALAHHWHTSGLWLIVTPFLVLKPFVRDSWRVALHRSLGTLAGVALVVALALGLPHTLPLQVPAITLAVITAAIAARHGHPAVMITALTATIVLFNSNNADLLLMADKRLQSCSLGIAITLSLMAVAHPIEARFRPAGASGP